MLNVEETSGELYVLRRGLRVRFFTEAEEETIQQAPYAYGLQGVYDYLAFCHVRQRYGRGRIRRSSDGYVTLQNKEQYAKPRPIAIVCDTSSMADSERRREA